MRKELIEIMIFVLGLFGYVTVAVAQVDHVSINSRQFELNSVPQLKVNIVAQNEDVSRLTFYISQVNDGKFQQQKLTVQTINRFLLQLNGTDVITDKNAQLIITEFTPLEFVTLAAVAVFDAPYSFKSDTLGSNINNQSSSAVANVPTKKAPVEHSIQQPESAALSSTTQSIASKETTAPQINCLIERDNSDTLWRIANRYKQQWHTSVYGAMLAIFEANLSAFSKQKIHLLFKDVPLHCPSTAILAQYNDIQVDKEVFEAIQAKHNAQ